MVRLPCLVRILSIAAFAFCSCSHDARADLPGNSCSNNARPDLPGYCKATVTESMIQRPSQYMIDLVARFRPYLKTSLNGASSVEDYRPASWSWFLARASFVYNYQSHSGSGCAGYGTGDEWPDGTVLIKAPTDGTQMLAEPLATVRTMLPNESDPNGLGPENYKYALHLDNDDSRHGEDWPTVIASGDGMYAHVEEITDSSSLGQQPLLNIEYSIFWAYNNASCSHHHGDLTTINVVYDPNSDLMTRVTYSIHGYALEIFRLAEAADFSYETVRGEDQNGSSLSTPVMRLELSDKNAYQHGGSAHSPSLSFVRLAQDPVTGLYEHPVAYAERGSHEFWPNETGSITDAPKHDGLGFSYLPDSFHVLTPLPTSPDAPFVFLNGKFGSDPNAIMLHNTWYWPEGRSDQNHCAINRYCISEKRFTDKDPYVNPLGPLPWPPTAEYQTKHPVAYVGGQLKVVVHQIPIPDDASTYSIGPLITSFFNLSTYPFQDLLSAFSVTPCGGTVQLSAATYTANLLQRACSPGAPITLKSDGGTVTIRHG